MLRTKLIQLTCIAMLSLGMSSQASADAIFDVIYTATQTGSDDFGRIYDLEIGFVFESTTCAGADCDEYLDGLYGITVFLDVLFDGIVDVLSVDALDNWDEDWGYFPGDDQVSYLWDWATTGIDGLVPPLSSLVLNMTFNNGAAEFAGLSEFDILFDWGDGYDLDGNPTDTFVTINDLSSVSSCPANECGVAVPEPGTLGLLGLGLFGLAARRRRKI